MQIFRRIASWFRPPGERPAFTLVKGPNGEKMMVDAETLAHLRSTAPQPTQAALDRILDRVRTVRVFRSGCRGETILADDLVLTATEPADLAALRRALNIAEGPGGHCMCHGGPTLEVLAADGTRLALLGVHHGQAIRWNRWKDDARLADGRSLLGWLAERGFSEPLRESEAAQSREREEREAWVHWVDSMPAYIKSLPQEMWRRAVTSADLSAVLAAAAQSCPNAHERILGLFEWFGNGAGAWNPSPAWEQFPERLLLEFSLAELVDAADPAALAGARIEGAARFFAGWAFQTRGTERAASGPLAIGFSQYSVSQPSRSGQPIGLPEALRRRLWEHCENSTDPDKRQRAESAFRGPPRPDATPVAGS